MKSNEVSQEQSATESLSSSHHVSPKQVPIEERAITAGNFVVINGYRVNRTLLTQRFAEGGYQTHETPHFLLFTRADPPGPIVVHWFAPEEMHADLKHYLAQELKPFGIITQSQHFGELLSGIVGSLFPDDVRRAWRFFGANTLQRFLRNCLSIDLIALTGHNAGFYIEEGCNVLKV